MRKYLFSFLCTIALTLTIPLSVNASGVALDPSTVSSFSDMSDIMATLSFTSKGLIATNSLSSYSSNAFQFGAFPLSDLWSWDINDYNVRTLTAEEKEQYINPILGQSLFGSNGQLIGSSEDVYLVELDNGFFHGSAYVDSQGNLLYNSQDLGGRYLALGLGGNLMSVSDYETTLDSLSSDIFLSNLNWFSSSEYDVDTSLFYYFGYQLGVNNKSLYSVFVPNVYDLDTVYIQPKSVSTPIGRLYFNGENNYVKTILYTQGMTSHFGVSNYNDYVNGHYYQYVISLEDPTGADYKNKTLDEFLNTNSGYKSYAFFYNGFVPDNSNLNDLSDNIINFHSYDIYDDSLFDLDKSYSYDDVISGFDDILDFPTDLDDSFDPDLPTSPENKPYIIDIPEGYVIPGDTVELPGIGKGDPDIPAEGEDDPAIEYPLEGEVEESSVIDSFNNFNIPFFSNLQYRFPFSIPWDIKQAIIFLGQQPEAPAWNFDWKIHFLNREIVYHFEGDLSDFDDLAELFRLLQLCSFIIFLAIFSYKQFF